MMATSGFPRGIGLKKQKSQADRLQLQVCVNGVALYRNAPLSPEGEKHLVDVRDAFEAGQSHTAPAPRLLTPAQDHERTRHLVTALKKKGFTDKQKREIALRDGGCMGQGSYGPCSDSQPLALCQADHIDPDGLNAVDNGQMLCGNCHDWKTAVENGWWKP